MFTISFVILLMTNCCGPRKGSLIKTQTRILNNRLYYTRKIDLHRKGKKSRTVRITPILICGIWWPSHLTGMCGTSPFLWWVRAQGRSPHAPGISKIANGPVGIPLIRGASGVGRWTSPPEGSKSMGGRPPEAEGNLQVPRHTRPDPCRW